MILLQDTHQDNQDGDTLLSEPLDPLLGVESDVSMLEHRLFTDHSILAIQEE